MYSEFLEARNGGSVERTCTIPAGKAILLPIINVEGVPLGEPEGTYLAVSEGYWVFLEPLPPGQHDIRVHGASIDPTTFYPTPSFETAVTYHLIVSDTAAVPSAEQATNAATNNTTTILTNQ